MELQADVDTDEDEEDEEDEEVVVVIRSSSVEKSNLLWLELEHARLVMRRGAATETRVGVRVGDSLDVERRNFCFPDRVLLWDGAAVGGYGVWDSWDWPHDPKEAMFVFLTQSEGLF